MTVFQTTIENRLISVPAPANLPDGTAVSVTVENRDEKVSGEEIEQLLSRMDKLLSLEIPNEVELDLQNWEKQLR